MDEQPLSREEALTLLLNVKDIAVTLDRLERLDPTLSRRRLTPADAEARRQAAENARRLRALVEQAEGELDLGRRADT